MAAEDAQPGNHSRRDGNNRSDIGSLGLTDDERRTLRPARLAKVAATHLSLRDLTAEVHRLSKQDIARVTRQLNKNANAPAAAIAQALRVALAKFNEESACRGLHDALHYGVLATGQTAELQAREVAALLTAEPTGLRFLIRYALRDTLAAGAEEFGVSAHARAAVWSSMICSGHEGDVAALGWLVADQPEYWSDSQRRVIAEVWTQVRERLPDLPERPAPLAALCGVVADLERTGTLEAMAADAGTVSDTGETSVADGSFEKHTRTDEGGLSPAHLESLAAKVTGLQGHYHEVRSGALTDVSAAMSAGRVPPRDSLCTLETLAADMETLLRQIADATGCAVAGTLEQALDDLDSATTAQTAAIALPRIRRLTALCAPEYVAAEAAEIAEMAAGANADTDPSKLAALDALVAAVDLGGSDPQRSTELVRTVQTGLPKAAVLVMLASNGVLSIGNARTTPAMRSEPISTGTAGDSGADRPAPQAQADATRVGDGSLDIDVASGPHTPAPGPGGADEPGRGDAESSRDDSTEPAGRADADTVAESGSLTAPDISQAEPAPTEAADATVAPAAGGAPAGGPPGEPATTAPIREPSIDEVLAQLDLDIPAAAAAQAVPTATSAAPAIAGSHAGAVGDTGQPASQQAVDVNALYSSLMDSMQFSLAGWITEIVGGPPVAVASHRLAAHALAIRASTGPNVAAFKDLIATIDTDALRDLPGAQMLVYAASVRAGLLSPTAGAADPLRDMCPAVVKCGAAVRELTDALLTCIYSGAYLTPRSSNAVAEVASLESGYADLVETARALLGNASSRSIRYPAATELFKAWMAPAGYLGAALSIVASGSRRAEDLKFVRVRVTELRSRSEVESAIDRDTLTLTHSKRSRRIEARARDKLIERASDVADVLASWVEATEALTQSINPGWMSGQIADLRARVSSARAAAFAELTPLTESDTMARNAAVDAGLALLESSLDLLTAGAQMGSDPELPADRVANGMLSLADGLPLDATPTLAPRRAVTVTDIAAAAALVADSGGWTTAFNRRTERADHVGSAVIVEMLRGHDPALARRLAAIRDRDAAAATDTLDKHVAELAAQIDSDRRFGRLDADTWAQLSIRARALEAGSRGSRRDFDVMEATLTEIGEDRAKAVAETIEAKWQQLARLQADASLTDDQAVRISNCIADEDITTAEEYFETLRSRGELPAPRGISDHLIRFFPAFPAMFAAATRGPAALTELLRAIHAGHNPGEGPLADALTGAGIDIALIQRGSTASSRLERWKNLAGSRTLDGRLSQVKPVLEQIGFLAAKADTPSRRKSQVPGVSSWMHLTGVRGTEGDALIPAFGSKISPTGDTLRVLALWKSPTPGRLVELLRDEPTDHSVLVLYFGTLGVNARRELATLFHSGPKLPATIVVDDAAFGYLTAQPVPRRDTAMAITLPFASSAPFTPNVAGLVPVEMFHGRTEELDQVVNMMGSCIVYGGRQLGKSALLRAAAREFEKGEHREAIYQSIYKVGQGAVPADKVWTTLWPRLAEKGISPEDRPSGDIAAAATSRIANWIEAVPGRQLLLLLDESDFFLDADAKEGKFTHVAAFRELMEQTGRAVKVVFAGLHQTARFERLANHPLAHFGDPICVGPLTPQHAYDLLTEPLHALGYRFEDDNVAARVLALANNQPSLIQLFGAKLLTHLDRQGAPATLPQIVTAAHIEAVWSDESLRESFRKRFDWTLNLDPRYKIIAYTVAYHAHSYGVGSALSPTELRSQCEQWWPQGFATEDVRTGEFRALLDECVALGVLSYSSAEGEYRLRTPNVLALLGSREEVEDVLDAAESTPLPESFDGSLLRPAFAGSITRSPLTSAQIADLLAARNQVRVIAGTDALTVARCARVLRDENAYAVYGARSIPIKEATAASLDSACRSAANTAGHSVVLADLRTVTHSVAAQAWAKAREVIAARAGGTLGIILITGAAQAPLWVRATTQADASSNLTALHRYDNTGLRLWLNETAIPFQDDASRADLLAVSGGWPMLLNHVAEASAGEYDADALEELRGWLAQPVNAHAFLDALGVHADDVLGAGWDFLVTALAGDASDAQILAEFMALSATEGQYAALTPERLSAVGYGSTEALVDVFRTLGVLVADPPDGQLRLEPVAATAAACASSITTSK